MISIDALTGLRALVVGLGREGKALALYLAKHGLTVTATDTQTAPQLNKTVADLAAAGVLLVLGEHPLSLLDEADILFVSPGLPLETPFLEAARSRQIPLSTESKLFCVLCPAQILGITGSNGKTTTTTLVGEMMKAAGRTTWVGGNIGRPLIEVVDQIGPDDIVVLELSSFQLEYFHAELNQNIPNVAPEALAMLLGNWSPQIGAILNITPNHLDRHPSMKHYVRAKRALINYQGPQGRLIMSLDNDMTRTIGGQFGSRTRWFSLEAQLPNGASLVGNEIVLFDQNERPQRIATRNEVKLRGMHNLSNILAACLMCREAGGSFEAMRQVVTSFPGVEHRLQFVRELEGVKYYDDSIATSPERLAAALRSFDEPLVLLVGGRDKHLPWDEVARLMMHKTRHIILFGEAAPLVAKAINRAWREINPNDVSIQQCVTLEEAVNLAHQAVQRGEVVLLSPGCTSFDAFQDFAKRGRRFVELVMAL